MADNKNRTLFDIFLSMARILMIDDDIDLLMVTKSLLIKKGFEAEVSSDWSSAFEKIRHFNPDLILLDIFLNKADGLEICNKLKSSKYTRHIPILILSGFSSFAESAVAEYGAEDFIAKPFDLNEIILKIKTILTRYGK